MKTGTSRRHRAYQQAARAEQTAANGQSIVDAAIELVYSVRRLEEITLEAIAGQSGLTVRTILRRFGSREGILEAAFVQLGRKMQVDRPNTPPGDIEAALGALLQHYELDGDLNIKALAQEADMPLLHMMMERGRKGHRAWLHEVFAPYIAHLSGAARERRITEFYAATDVYLWKLFRRDLRLGKEQTAEAFRRLVLGVAGLNQDQEHANGSSLGRKRG
ncbi:MAG TPA: hypothetical protein VKW06_20800 [Candidatus Angelobacter sp.]|nr:hypothetical protein [Candidatus Angelobacter sp.]